MVGRKCFQPRTSALKESSCQMQVFLERDIRVSREFTMEITLFGWKDPASQTRIIASCMYLDLVSCLMTFLPIAQWYIVGVSVLF